MQRLLANNLYAYAFPATFLIPFLIEPVATIYAPYKMMLAIVRTQPCMKGFMAERLLGSLVFDLSRYADLMLDVPWDSFYLQFSSSYPLSGRCR